MATITPTIHPGMICTVEEFMRSITDTSIRCLTRGESLGLTAVTASALLSLLAVLYAMSIILRGVVWRFRHVREVRLHIFHQPMDLLIFCLFVADILQATGAVMDIKWIHTGKVEVGTFCNAQGIVQQLGETGVAMTTLLISLFTFFGIWMGKDIRSMALTSTVVGAVWSFIILMVVLGNVINRGQDVHFQAPTPYWCWISEGYLQWRIWGEYIWFWITLIVSTVIYVPLYFWSRGNIQIDDRAWWKFSFQRAGNSAVDPALKGVRRRALIMLIYPLVYCVSILPLSIIRWITFVNKGSESGTATFIILFIYGLSGACNVVLFLTTRPNTALFGRVVAEGYAAGRAPSLLSEDRQSIRDNANANEEETEAGQEKEGSEDIPLGRLPSR
ncbi:hypothetical protein D9619_001330 [Psilocybe cf. subviscida]|uniref:Glucose receptor Git3 N-terminal domain-containing protein n=1 Tax=Psilocybe cf. subviscida TaxID=2480587 RepID=A0A8H5BCJ2_9AGAR|nr:hypothetical protein D9619_001330 [Psilocybe cf. subviscida]